MNNGYKPYTENENEEKGFVVEEEDKSNDSDIDDSLYNDGADRKPKLIIMIIGIVCLVVLILIIAIACSKMNKKSSNNYLTTLRVSSGTLSPEYSKDKTEYQVVTAEDVVTINCSADSSKATAIGCGKRIYPEDEGCVDHEIKVVAEDKKERKYKIKVCRQEDSAPIIKSVELSPEGYTKTDVVVTVNVDSKTPLHKSAYSFDGGLSWQESNKYTVTENTTLEIKVRNEDNIESTVLSKDINNIDKSNISVVVRGSVDSGTATQSNVELTAIPTPATSTSGYRYQWYNGNTKISGATGSVYIAKSSGNYKVAVSTGSGNRATSKEYKVVINKSSGGSGKTNAYKLELSVTGNPTTWTSNDVTLKVTATASNGLPADAYSFDGGKTYQKSNTKTFTSNQTVSIVVKDKKNNKATYKVYITKIDKTVPTVKILGTRALNSKLVVSVSPTAKDYKYQWYKDGKKLSATGASYTPTSAGKYYVTVTTKAGVMRKSEDVTITSSSTTKPTNPTTPTKPTTPTTPTKLPTVVLSGSIKSGTLTNKDITLTAKLSDGTATKYEWYKGNNLYSKCTSSTCVVGESGTYKVRAVTSKGTTDFSGAYTANIDKAGPTVTITAKVGGPSGKTYTSGDITNDKLYIKVDAEDEKSNLSEFEFKYISTDKNWYSDPTKEWSAKVINGKKGYAEVTFSEQKKYSFKVRVKDKFGNVTEKSLPDITIKTAKPSKPTINLSSTAQTTSNVTFTITKPSDLGSGGKVQYSYDKKNWTNYSSKVTLLDTTGVKTVYARSLDSKGTASDIVSATGKCNKDGVTVSRNSNGSDSGNKCWVKLDLKLVNTGLSGISNTSKFEYVYWSPKKTNDTVNKGKVSVCGEVPTTGIKTTTTGTTAKLYLMYSNQYYCFAVRPYRSKEISGLNRWTVQRKLANTSSTCATSAYNGN